MVRPFRYAFWREDFKLQCTRSVRLSVGDCPQTHIWQLLQKANVFLIASIEFRLCQSHQAYPCSNFRVLTLLPEDIVCPLVEESLPPICIVGKGEMMGASSGT